MNTHNNFFIEVVKEILSDLGSRVIRKILWGIIGDSAFSLFLLRIDFLQLSQKKGNMFAFIAYFFMVFGVIVFFIAIFYSVRKLYMKDKLAKSHADEIAFTPRNGQINNGLWDSYYAWLEIVGDLETEKYTAILKKLESEKDGVVTNYLLRATNSSAPRLRIVDEKLFVAETKVTDVIISLKDGIGKPLPKGEKFYFEVDLMNGKKLIKTFKGYLVGGYPDLQIKSI